MNRRRETEAEHTTLMTENRNEHRMLIYNLKRYNHLEDLGIHVRTLLKWVLNK
jgi:hypothetical protein